MSVLDAYTGVELDNSQASTITYNHMTSPGTGFYDYYGSSDTWAHNTASAAVYEGFYAEHTTNLVIKANTVTGGPSGDGIDTYYATSALIARNHLSPVYDGVYDEFGSSDTISHNSGTGDAWGIYAYQPTGLTLTGNTFGYGNYGIETLYPASETLTGNVTDHNAEVGTYINTNGSSGSYAATLNTNAGNDNRFGLYADFATAGTGNHATGNTVINCYNVTCTAAAAAGPGSTGVRPPYSVPKRPVTPARP